MSVHVLIHTLKKVCWQYLFDWTRITLTTIGMLLQFGHSKTMWLWKEIEKQQTFLYFYKLIVNIGIYFISTWLYYNQIVVTFRLGTRLSSSNQIAVLNTPLYCVTSWLSSEKRPEKKPFKLKVFLEIYRKLRKDPDHLIFMND
jgi:hypothetical protein